MRPLLFMLMAAVFLQGCSKVKPNITNQYRLVAFSDKKISARPHGVSILVSQPLAVGGYQTSAMLYIKKAYELDTFSSNGWVSPPADMMHPLLFQSLQSTGYFNTVASSPDAEATDYRLDTQLIELQQNFLGSPSKIDLTAKVVLSNTRTSQVMASRIISRHIPCAANNPYAGVIAANQAMKELTAEVSDFVIRHVRAAGSAKEN